MKKFWYVGVILIPLIVLVLFTGCPSTDSGGGGVYYIRATIDGTNYEWTLGLTDIESNAFGSYYPSEPGTDFAASQTEVASTDPEPNDTVYFYIVPSTAATASYTISDFVWAYIRISGTYWDFTAITFEITKYGPVGGTIEGTFSGTLQEFEGIATMTVTNGQLMVKRAGNDAW